MDYDELAKQFGGVTGPAATLSNQNFDAEPTAAPKFNMQPGEVVSEEGSELVGDVSLGPATETEVNYDALATQFGGVAAPTPATETEVNYDALATQFGGVAGETPVDPADREATFFGEFGRGFGTTVETAKFIPEVVGLQNAAATSSTARKELAMFDRIDKGEPVTPELLAGSGLSGLFVNMYKNASPEKRQKLRDMQAKQLSEAQNKQRSYSPH